MSKASGYSLWLVPDVDSEVHRVLKGYIAAMSKEYQTPNFVPHVTLLGGVDENEVDICCNTRKLANELAPYEIEFGGLGSNGIYFQILFSKVELTEAVMHANTLAQRILGVNQGIYFPHLSLAYGDFSPKELAVMGEQLQKRIGSVSGMRFLVREIELWRTEGKVADWHKVAVFPLNPRNPM